MKSDPLPGPEVPSLLEKLKISVSFSTPNNLCLFYSGRLLVPELSFHIQPNFIGAFIGDVN